MSAIEQNFGEEVFIQFEDIANPNAFNPLDKYRISHLMLNDDIQSTSSVVLAGKISPLRLLA
ncbi:hypothetical protein ABFX02_10G122400 [Erythranthe guttata]